MRFGLRNAELPERQSLPLASEAEHPAMTETVCPPTRLRLAPPVCRTLFAESAWHVRADRRTQCSFFLLAAAEAPGQIDPRRTENGTFWWKARTAPRNNFQRREPA